MNLSPRRRLFLRMVSGSLWRRRDRVWIALGAVAIGISVGAGLLLVSRDVERMVARELRVYGPNIIVRPRSEEAASGLRDVRVGAVHSRETFSAPAASWPNDTVTPQGPVRSESALSLLYGSARAQPNPMRWETVVVAGTDLAKLQQMYTGWSYRRAAAGGANRVPIFVGSDAAKRIRVAPGDTLFLRPLAEGGEPVHATVAAVFQAGASEDGIVYAPLDAAQRLFALPGRVSVVLVRASGSPPAIDAAIARGWLAGDDREAAALRRLTGAARELLGRLRALLTAVTAFALITASLCTMSTLTDLVLERRREIALLKSLGAGRGDVVLLFLTEAGLLGLAGGLAGFVIGAVAAQVVGASVFHTAIRIDFARVLPEALLLAILVTLVSSLPPVRYALALDPARALRGE
ncbi:MAG TPA: FtsX-like permease family protein [Candidatus Eisenbacteria bacterium]|nr:FtsX-like permease family protein [Candidatus Eisenbacteria bacterium]